MNEAMLENGEYDAVILPGASVYENGNNVLVVLFQLAIEDIQRRVYVALTKKSGEINEIQLKKLEEIFPKWDGDNPSWFLEDSNIEQMPVIATVLNEPDTKGKIWSNVKDIRSPNSESGGGDFDMPKSLDAKILATKYGAKFRALKGGKSVKPNKPIKPEHRNA